MLQEIFLGLGLALPLLGFLTLILASYRIKRRQAGMIGCITVFLSFLCFIALLLAYVSGKFSSFDLFVYNWMSIQGMETDFSLHLDSLSLLMALIITGIGFLIHVYSIGYMDHDGDYARYFACLNFFIFAMLLLVLAGDLILLFIGWEGVGLASYLLIGFWYERPSAAKAATKAFIVNRIGDLGFLLGILLTYYAFGTTDIHTIILAAPQKFSVGAPILVALTLLYFWGATGKSAQLPLYNWLPDAMEGPTPVSALIHAATMVTAGVYLVVRMNNLFLLAPETLQVIGIVGGLTALFAALCAAGQNDLKRVLAYSTVSQLGLMFLACGVGAFYAAMFHLTAHAFVKALLFLSAGNVVHMLHGETNMDRMGGLAKIFTKTNWLFLIGVLALSGIPPFATFFSKDLILELENIKGSTLLFIVGLTASILTAFYMTRAYCLTFKGQKPASIEASKTTEAPVIMLIPVSILALLSIIGGYLGFALHDIPPLESFLSEVGITPAEKELSTGFHSSLEVWLAILGSMLGVGLAAWLYTHFRERLGHPVALLKNAFFVDTLYQFLIVKPLRFLARVLTEFFEAKIFENSFHVAAQATQGTAAWMQQIQSGQIRSYIAWMVMGVALFIVYFILKGMHT